MKSRKIIINLMPYCKMLPKPHRYTCFYFLSLVFVLLQGCTMNKRIGKAAEDIILKDSAARSGFTGISIYEPASGKYWYNYNATKYFTPASNTKLFTLYAGMKYTGDSLCTAKIREDRDALYIFPNADPGFLNPEFSYQPLLELLKQTNKNIIIIDTAWKEKALGYGWAWDDYNDDYMAERSAMPVFGNTVYAKGTPQNAFILPRFFKDSLTWDSSNARGNYIGSIKRDLVQNTFYAAVGAKKEAAFVVPYITLNGYTNYQVLENELGKKVFQSKEYRPVMGGLAERRIYSQPKDSLFRVMMHRSDNFFAEQTLLMASNERLGLMNDESIIDTLLANDLRDIPQKPKWVDGSGLSRYNLFTPQSFIYILNKLSNEFGLERLKNILPTGGQGTLRSYFKNDQGYIFAKTGTLSNNCALSGFLLTNKGKLLIFSILANHYQTGATPIRKATERFLEEIRKKY